MMPSSPSSAAPLNAYWLSRAWEVATGVDSIATIERVYERTGTNSQSGAYICVWPGCRFARRDPEKLWRHVHSAHGENGLPPVDWDSTPYHADIDES